LVDLQDKCVNLLVEAGAKSLQGCERLLNGAPDHSGLVLAGSVFEIGLMALEVFGGLSFVA
jgi:hypothetical protein